MRVYNTDQLQETASEFCKNLCGLRGTDFCLITEGSIACPVQNYVDYLEQGKNLRY